MRDTMESRLMNVFGSAYNDLLRDTNPEKLEEEAELFLARGDHDNATLKKIGDVLKKFASKYKSDDDPAGYLMGVINSSNCSCCQDFLASIYYLYFPEGRSELDKFKDSIPFVQTQKIRRKLQNGLERNKQAKDFYELLHERFNKYKENKNFFINLKGMSSSSPILYNSALHKDYAGGGFYLKWNGFGIAVDPGYNFAKNLSKYGLTIHDIQAVIITHDHIDHSSDARLLLDMEYQLHQEGKDYIQWYVDTKTAKTLETWMDGREENLTIIDPESHSLVSNKDHQISLNNSSILLCPFLTKHVLVDKEKSLYQTGTFGFVLKLQDKDSSRRNAPYLFGYTSDTTYFLELSENLSRMDFLLANISSVREQELVHPALEPYENPYHLGLTGIIKMLRKMETPPRLLAISEFWNGISDIRYDITNYIGEYLRMLAEKKDWTIVPLESGISIEIPRNYIRCSFCGSYVKRIHILRPKADFEEMQFACRDCIY